MGKELTVTEKQSAIVLPAVNIEGLITQGLERAASIDVMERLFLMRRELKAEAAREAFFTALSKLQAEMPAIEKTKQVKEASGKVRYSYAPLDSIVEQTKNCLQKNGFSYTIKVVQTETKLTVICEAHHAAGHTEATELTVPIDLKSYMTDSQRVGASNSFAKRYAFCNAFGVLTCDADTDAVGPETPPATAKPPAAKATPAAEVKSAPNGEKTAKNTPPAGEIKDDTDEYRKKELLIHLHKYVYEPAADAGKAAKEEYFSKAKIKLGAWAKMAGFAFTTFKSLEGKNLQDILIIARAESAGI